MAETLTIEVIDKGATQTGSAAPTRPDIPSAPTRPGIPSAPRIDGRGRPGGLPSAIPIPGIDKAAATGNVPGIFASLKGAALAALGPFGIAVTAAAGAFTAAAVVVRKFGKVVENEVSNLAGLSGPVAAAQAQTEIDRLTGQIRRAQRIGPELARAERLRSKFESAMSDLGTEILGLLLELVEMFRPTIEFATDAIKEIVDFLEENRDAIANLLPIILNAGVPIPQFINFVLGWLRRREETDDEEDPFNRAFESIMAAAGQQTELDRQIVAGPNLGIDVGA